MAHKSGDIYDRTTMSPDSIRAHEGAERLIRDRKLIVASNRGPLYFSEDTSGALRARRDNSRAMDLFKPLADVPVTWVSGAISAADRNAAASSENVAISDDVLPSNWSVRFIASPRRVHHKFYNVICNPLLWFMLHRSWSPTFTPNIGDDEQDAWERGYRSVNEAFSDAILEASTGEKIAFISRDYQLMLVPGTVRSKSANAVIHHGFETPWPWPTDFEILPPMWRTEILESLLASNIISFPSDRDIQAFVSCVNTAFEGSSVSYDRNSNVIEFNKRQTRLAVSPPTTRSDDFSSVVELVQTKGFVSGLRSEVVDHTFVTVDRAEPHKNIVRTIKAFEMALRRRPDLAERARFMLFLSPGPSHISAYKRLSEEIRRAARRVNEKYVGKQPVKIYEENNFFRAAAAMSAYDTLVSVPLVDGTDRAAFDGPLVNTRQGGMILTVGGLASELYGDNVSRVGFSDLSSLANAMIEAVDESAEHRKQKSVAIRKIATSLDHASPMQAVVNDLNNAAELN